MKLGKVPGSVLHRSVLKNITKRTNVRSEAKEEADKGAVMCRRLVTTVNPVTVPVRFIGQYGVQLAATNLACAGARPESVLLSLLLPPDAQEQTIKQLMQQADAACMELGMYIAGGHTEVTECVTSPLLTVTGTGVQWQEEEQQAVKPGMDIVMTKWCGLAGTSILVSWYQEKLKKQLPLRMLDNALAFDGMLCAAADAQCAYNAGAAVIQDVTNGGIFGALWELAQASGVGLEIDLRTILLRQETVEVCEILSANPYLLYSGGALLIAADNGHAVVQSLKKRGTAAAVIGRATDSNDRLIFNDDEKRFLDPPKKEELWRIFQDTI